MLDWSDTETTAAAPAAPALTATLRPQTQLKLEPVDPTGLGAIDRAGGRVSRRREADDQLPRRRQPAACR